MTYLMEMGSTPFRGVFASVAIEDGEEALSADVVKVNNKRVGILHRSSCSFIFGYTHLERGILSSMSVQNLDKKVRTSTRAMY